MHTQRWISLNWSFLYAFLWWNIPGALPWVPSSQSSTYHLPAGQGCRVSAVTSVTSTKKSLANPRQLWLAVRSRMCEVNGMLPRVIQAVAIHITQPRSPEFAFCHWLTQQTRCLWEPRDLWLFEFIRGVKKSLSQCSRPGSPLPYM